jgi:hypothetical protein
MELVRSRTTRQQRAWGVCAFLVAAISPFGLVLIHRQANQVRKTDRSSIRATFNSISADGSQRQITFHYSLENTSGRNFGIDRDACSTVSFRFTDTRQVADAKQGGPARPAQPNPALNLLESDTAGYTKATGLVRLPTNSRALVLDQCPLELQPKQRKEVAIAIPYAYPAEDAGPSPSDEELKAYVGAFMPQIEGFGMADASGRYQVEFPRAW